ncbi:hypothetical protein ES708_31018 [subsurface metagenome]
MPAVASLYSPPQKNKVRLFIIEESIKGEGKTAVDSLLLFKYKRGHYRDPLSLAPLPLANLFVILLSFVV